MPDYGALLKLGIILHCCLIFIKCQCILDFPTDRRRSPVYEKTFGTRKIKVTFRSGHVHLSNGEVVAGVCHTQFSDFKVYEDRPHVRKDQTEEVPLAPEIEIVQAKRKILLICLNGVLKYQRKNFITKRLSCEPLRWGIYASNQTLPWCAPNAVNFVLASMSLGTKLTLAAVCYDAQTTLMKNVRYFAGPKSSMIDYIDLLSMVPKDFEDVNLSAEIKSFSTTFGSERENVLDRELITQNNLWLELANYEQFSLVQDLMFDDDFVPFGHFLHTIWWPNLRLGNWRRFTRALNERINLKVYNLYLGTSVAVPIPIEEKLKELRIGSWFKSVHNYIWAYVQAEDHTEEFVVIGYNSPFYEFFPKDKIIFCRDICDAISWLKWTASTFRYATMGIVFCCKVDDVRQTRYLDGFPLKVVKPTRKTTSRPTFTLAPYMTEKRRKRYPKYP